MAVKYEERPVVKEILIITNSDTDEHDFEFEKAEDRENPVIITLLDSDTEYVLTREEAQALRDFLTEALDEE